MTAVHGLDLSLTATGIATPRGLSVVRSSGRRDATLDQRHERLVDLRARITGVLSDARALAGDLVVVEAPSFGSAGAGTWDRAGLWWLMVDRLHQLGYAVAQVPPSVLKKYATGRGNADKGAMADAAARRIPDVRTDGQDDLVDALWLRAAGLDWLDRPLVALPAAQRAVLASVAWPLGGSS